MTAETVTLLGRAQAEAIMVDTCTIARPGTTPVVDPNTGVVTYPPTTVYSGKCRVQMPTGTRGDSSTESGERANFVQSPVVSVPVSVVGLRVADVITVTASEMDPDLAGTVMKVTAIARKSFLTARRLICQEVTG